MKFRWIFIYHVYIYSFQFGILTNVLEFYYTNFGVDPKDKVLISG
jgi:hypothetical protein